MDNKKWWESRTLWVNALTLASVVVAQVVGWEDMKQYAPELLMISNIVNMLLRLITTNPIK
jgi:hypothetical protein